MASLHLDMALFDQPTVEAIATLNHGVVIPTYCEDGASGEWEVAAPGRLEVNRPLLDRLLERPLSHEQWRAILAGARAEAVDQRGDGVLILEDRRQRGPLGASLR